MIVSDLIQLIVRNRCTIKIEPLDDDMLMEGGGDDRGCRITISNDTYESTWVNIASHEFVNKTYVHDMILLMLDKLKKI